jgi:regulator of RNase E activity RraA
MPDGSGDRLENFGHVPLVPPRIGRRTARLPVEVLDRLRRAYVPDLSDAVGALYTMDAAIRPLYEPTPKLVGQALTVKAPPGDNLTVHGALSLVHEGDVLVIDWRGRVEGCATGAGSLVEPVDRGLVGAVVDGGWRDVGELRAMAFPVFGRGIAAYSPPKERIGEINVPVSCGGVVVMPGDVVVGDEDGVVVVPAAYAAVVAGGIRDYRPRLNVDEWNLDSLRETAATRREYFKQAFARRGGVLDGE